MRAWGENVIVTLEDQDHKGELPLKGEIVSLGYLVDSDLEEGMTVIFGKYAGQQLDDNVILNYKQILAIDE